MAKCTHAGQHRPKPEDDVRHHFPLVVAFCVFASAALGSPEFWKHEWPRTNFAKTSIANWVEIISGGPPRDGIPALNDPKFIEARDERRIAAREPVITVAFEGARARAYPIRYLTWHEIVNDTVGGVPIAVTFCPLCNSAVTFDRRVPQGVMTFGVSGKLRFSDIVMFDRETESWWQQAVGEAIVGDLTGTKLRSLPTWMESWAEFTARYPDGLVMAEPDSRRRYGSNPYRGYDTSHKQFLSSPEVAPHGLPAVIRSVMWGSRAWPSSTFPGQLSGFAEAG